MGESIYWIWLQKILGYGNRNTEQVVDFFKGPEGMYKASDSMLRECVFLSHAQREMAQNEKIMDDAVRTYEQCKRLGINILTPDDVLYPQRLYDICDYPAVLYYKGEIPEMDDNVVLTMVGTRKASADGKMAASALAQSLTECGAIIMSGGARGIDDASHQGALRVGGVTLSVLGCGLDVDYNPNCEETRSRILQNGGALISEFPPGFGPSKVSFPIRNRLLSAMSVGVIVGETPAVSGALITARHAMEMGRDMFAIPGSAVSVLSEGANMLIKDGAKPVSCAFDVLEEYNARYPHRLKMRSSQTPISQIARNAPEFVDIELSGGYAYLQDNSLRNTKNKANEQIKAARGRAVDLHSNASETAKAIYNLLKDYSLNLDELCERLSLPAHRLLTAITELEINNIISSDSQRKYTIRKQ